MAALPRHSPRQVDSALDAALVIAIFGAVDQLMLSHEAIDYDVECVPVVLAFVSAGLGPFVICSPPPHRHHFLGRWPSDYSYAIDQITTCFGPRKAVRKAVSHSLDALTFYSIHMGV